VDEQLILKGIIYMPFNSMGNQKKQRHWRTWIWDILIFTLLFILKFPWKEMKSCCSNQNFLGKMCNSDMDYTWFTSSKWEHSSTFCAWKIKS